MAPPSSTEQAQGAAELDEFSVHGEAPAQDASAESEVVRDEGQRLSPDRDRPPTPPAEPVPSRLSPLLPAASSPVRALSITATPSRAGSSSLAEMQLMAKVTAMQAAAARGAETQSELEKVSARTFPN